MTIQYARNDRDPPFGTFRVRGDTVEVRAAFEERVLRIEFFGDGIEALTWVEPLTGRALAGVGEAAIYPATQFVAEKGGTGAIVDAITKALEDRLHELDKAGRVVEAQRLASRTRYDLEMIQQVGHCAGVENYSRYFDARSPGERPCNR